MSDTPSARSTSLVERLRAFADKPSFDAECCLEAADEIERLRADNEWLRKTMRNAIAAQDWSEARRALEGK